MYFKRLEGFIAKDVQGEAKPLQVAYLYMSMIIEFRAVWSFAIYQSVLERAKIQMSLKSLLAEEQGHLEEMEANIEALGAGGSDRTRRFLNRERTLFARLLDVLETNTQADAAVA